MNTHAKKEKKEQISTKKAKQRQNISTKKKYFKYHSNTLIQPLINPLSSPYSDLIEICFNCYLVGCFKTPKKKSKTQSKPELEKSKRKKTTKMNTHEKKQQIGKKKQNKGKT